MDLLDILREQAKVFLPKLITATAILIVGWIIAKLVARLVKKLLQVLKIDDFSNRLNDIDIVQKANLKIFPSRIISKIVYYLLILLTLVVATDKLGVKAVTDLITSLINYLPSLLAALLLFIIGLIVADIIKGIVLTTCQSLSIPSAKIIANIAFYFIFLSVTMSALDQAKISTDFINSSLIIIIAGVVGAFALGYGLASKNIMDNFLASFYIKKKFNIGDKITIDGIKGEILEIDNSSFVIKTEKSKIIFPLSKLATVQVEVH